MTTVKENGSVTLATYAYDDLGRRAQVTHGNGATTTYGYDGASRLATLTHNLSGAAQDVTQTFAYNPAGGIVSQTTSNAAYDYALPPNFADAYTANGLNQITAIDGTANAHDKRGNVIGIGAKTFAYDDDNRLVAASGGGLVATDLSYDPAGRLKKFEGTLPHIKFLYAGSQAIAEYSSGGPLLRRFVPGAGPDETLVWYEGTTLSSKSWLAADARGSVVAVMNSSGAATATNKYDPYGVPAAGNAGRFQYTGQMWFGDIALYHYKARAYDPYRGRFMQTDPIGYAGGMNLYGYVGNDPVNFTDPWGLIRDCWATPTGVACGPNFGLAPFNFGGVGASFSFAGDRSADDAEGGGQCAGANALLTPETAAALAAAANESRAAVAARVAAALASRLLPPVAFAATLGGSTASDDMPQPQYVVRGGVTTPEQLMAGVSAVHGYPGLTGFSVSSAPGLSVEQIARIASYPHKQISVTSVGLLAAQGVTIARPRCPDSRFTTQLLRRNPLDPGDAARIGAVFKQMPNPARCN